MRELTVVLMVTLAVGCGGGGATKSVDRGTPEVTSGQRAQMAQSYLNAGRVSDALAAMEEAIEQDPENARIHHFAGQLNFRAGRYPEAEAAFKRALELDPYLSDAHNFLGAVYAVVGNPAEAERSYRRALADPAYPTPDKVHLNLGMLYAEQERDDEALAELRRAVEINPKQYRAHFEQAVILDRQGDLSQAVRLYEVAEPAFRSDGDYQYRLAMAYFKLDRKQQARERFHRCLNVAPGSESAAKCSEMLEIIN